MKTPKGFSNGAMWPSLFTGVNSSKHGRYNYLSIKPGTYNFNHLFEEDTDYQISPFWVDLSKQGKRVGIVDVPRAPLTPDINGFQIADWLTHDRRNAITRSYPENLAKNIIETFGEDEIQLNQIYHGQALDRLPDIIVTWNREYPIRLVSSEELGQFEVECYTHRTGEHNERAIFWLNSSSLISN
ncbi:MAG: hypothetical protein ACKO3K_19515 [Cuspidothrix sp.]